MAAVTCDILCTSGINSGEQVDPWPVMLPVSQGGFALANIGTCPPFQSSNDLVYTTAPVTTHALHLFPLSLGIIHDGGVV